jgi:guanyl-specific ribonuclease Sa
MQPEGMQGRMDLLQAQQIHWGQRQRSAVARQQQQQARREHAAAAAAAAAHVQQQPGPEQQQQQEQQQGQEQQPGLRRSGRIAQQQAQQVLQQARQHAPFIYKETIQRYCFGAKTGASRTDRPPAPLGYDQLN